MSYYISDTMSISSDPSISLRRMWNSSEFMRTYKQHFTMSFNARRDHHGTMFEGRYHERNHKPEKPVMWRTAAYVDINAWSAGIVKKAENYEWCSFAAAVGGDKKARRGYAFMYGNGDWETIRACHEKSMREAMGEVLAEREREKRRGAAHRPTEGIRRVRRRIRGSRRRRAILSSWRAAIRRSPRGSWNCWRRTV